MLAARQQRSSVQALHLALVYPNTLHNFIAPAAIDCGTQTTRILDANGLPPQGHQGKKDKAVTAWKAKKAAAQLQADQPSRSTPYSEVRATLTTSRMRTDDEDEYDPDDPHRVFAAMAGKGQVGPTTDAFQSLTSDTDAEDEPPAPSLGDRPSAGEMDFLHLVATILANVVRIVQREESL